MQVSQTIISPQDGNVPKLLPAGLSEFVVVSWSWGHLVTFCPECQAPNGPRTDRSRVLRSSGISHSGC